MELEEYLYIIVARHPSKKFFESDYFGICRSASPNKRPNENRNKCQEKITGHPSWTPPMRSQIGHDTQKNINYRGWGKKDTWPGRDQHGDPGYEFNFHNAFMLLPPWPS